MGYNPPPHGQAPGPRNPMLSRHVPDSGHIRLRASFASAASFLRVRNRSIQYATDTCLSRLDKAGSVLFAHFFEVAQPLCITLPNLVHPPALGSHVWLGSPPCSLQMSIRSRASCSCLSPGSFPSQRSDLITTKAGLSARPVAVNPRKPGLIQIIKKSLFMTAIFSTVHVDKIVDIQWNPGDKGSQALVLAARKVGCLQIRQLQPRG